MDGNRTLENFGGLVNHSLIRAKTKGDKEGNSFGRNEWNHKRTVVQQFKVSVTWSTGCDGSRGKMTDSQDMPSRSDEHSQSFDKNDITVLGTFDSNSLQEEGIRLGTGSLSSQW